MTLTLVVIIERLEQAISESSVGRSPGDRCREPLDPTFQAR